MPPELKDLEFPLYRYYISPPMIYKIMGGLKDYRIEKIKSNDKNILLFLKINYERDKNFLMLSDYFNGEMRMKSQFLNSISPWDYFQKNKKQIISLLGPRPDFETVYDYIWKNSRVCSSFPILVARAILDLFKPSHVFDPCAGWGDRMLACVSAGIPYTGVDPNIGLQKGYQTIIDFFDLNPELYKVYPSPFENKGEFKIDKKFPLIFTSPPFFNMEKYTDDPNQSNLKFQTYEKWRRGFLFPMIKGCLDLLEDNGKLVIYVNNIKGYSILDDTRGYLTSLNIKFMGKIVWKNNKYPKNVLVYQK